MCVPVTTPDAVKGMIARAGLEVVMSSDTMPADPANVYLNRDFLVVVRKPVIAPSLDDTD